MAGKNELWPEVDIVIFTVHEDELKVLLVERAKDSSAFPGAWALPGGSIRKHIEQQDTLEQVAMQELLLKTGARAPYLEQLGTFGGRNRDPRSWTITVAYFALIPHDMVSLNAGAKWWSVSSRTLRNLAFDHSEIVASAIQRLRAKLEYTAIAGYLLGEEFTLPALQKVYETILGEPLSKMSFRRSISRIEQLGVLEETGQLEESKGHRRAMLYRFSKDARSALFFPRSLVRNANRG